MPTLAASVLSQYRRFSLYNSPYVAHDTGCAIDLYPKVDTETDADDRVPSPVAGTVRDVRTIRAPPKEYAPVHDHLVLIDTGEHIARLLHADPVVEPGDHVAVGDALGTLVRAGFFAPWVDTHLHLEFRTPELDPYRASGSLAIDVDLSIEPLPWDGTGHVSSVGDTYVVLDTPTHPEPGACFVGIESGNSVLDGGCPHYDGGGLLVNTASKIHNQDAASDSERAVLAGTRIGSVDGRNVHWDAVEIRANGTPITGISLFVARDEAFGAKLICPDTTFKTGEYVEVAVHPE